MVVRSFGSDAECMIENPIALKLEWLPNLSGMMTLNLDGIIQQVNSSCESMFGVDETAMIGSDIRTWIAEALQTFPTYYFHLGRSNVVKTKGSNTSRIQNCGMNSPEVSSW